MEKRIEHRAIEMAMKYFGRDYGVKDVSKNKGGKKKHRGYDLEIRKDARKWKVEVKGSATPWGIPDLYGSEVKRKGGQYRLVADYLFVVYFIRSNRPQCCVIPRRAIKSYDLIPKLGFRIRSTFKKESVLRKFLTHKTRRHRR